jgi:DNA-binding MarR family transcriptional regulator
MAQSKSSSRPSGAESATGPAFLLAQVGAHAAARFAERLSPLGLTPAHAGVLRILARSPDMTQRALADLLGMFPSRLVLLLDDLEVKGLLERHARPEDRRSYALRLTAAGRVQLEKIGRVSRQHQADLCAALTVAETNRLRELLQKIATQQELRPGVHPGYAKRGDDR